MKMQDIKELLKKHNPDAMEIKVHVIEVDNEEEGFGTRQDLKNMQTAVKMLDRDKLIERLRRVPKELDKAYEAYLKDQRNITAINELAEAVCNMIQFGSFVPYMMDKKMAELFQDTVIKKFRSDMSDLAELVK